MAEQLCYTCRYWDHLDENYGRCLHITSRSSEEPKPRRKSAQLWLDGNDATLVTDSHFSCALWEEGEEWDLDETT